MDQRVLLISDWLKEQLKLPLESIEPLAGDASNRRYFRIHLPALSYILMDAFDQQDSINAFLQVTHVFQAQQINVPRVIAENRLNRLLLLTDFGDDILIKVLNDETADDVYCQAIDALLSIQLITKQSIQTLPHFDRNLMKKEVALFTDWFLNKQLELTLTDNNAQVLQEMIDHIISQILKQPYVCCHRDYHSRNLMLCHGKIGIIDYQDAVNGPITYDLVSLLRDCYIDWPLDRVHHWAEYYYEQAMHLNLLNCNFKTFLFWFDWTGIQRHMKAIGIFSRLNLHYHKPGYLKDIPRTLDYLLAITSHYPELTPLNKILNYTIKPATLTALKNEFIA